MKNLFIFAKVVKLYNPIIYTMKRTFVGDLVEDTHNSLAPVCHRSVPLQFVDIGVFEYAPYPAQHLFVRDSFNKVRNLRTKIL